MISLHKIAVVVIGSLLIAAGIDFFLMPIQVLDGGFIGIALISNYLFGIKAGAVLLVCSLPVFLYTWFKDKNIFVHSLFGMILLSYLVDLFDSYRLFAPTILAHPFASSIAGGTLIGTGFGIMLRNDTSTGGIDLLAKLLAVHLKINVGVLILFMDAIVVATGAFLFSMDTFFLSIATITAGGLATSLCTSKYFSY